MTWLQVLMSLSLVNGRSASTPATFAEANNGIETQTLTLNKIEAMAKMVTAARVKITNLKFVISKVTAPTMGTQIFALILFTIDYWWLAVITLADANVRHFCFCNKAYQKSNDLASPKKVRWRAVVASVYPCALRAVVSDR